MNKKKEISNLDTLPTLNNIKQIEKELNFFSDIGYGELNFDSLYKWSLIIKTFHKYFSGNSYNILDIGGGCGPLDMYFTNYGNVLSIDLNHETTWYPINELSFYRNSTGFKYKKQNLQRITANILETKLIKGRDTKFDFVYDSCSMIHFHNYGDIQPTKNIEIISKIVKNNLSKDSLFVTASHCTYPSSFPSRDFTFHENIDHAILNSGFSRLNKKGDFKDIKKIFRKRTDIGYKKNSINVLKSNNSENKLRLLRENWMDGRGGSEWTTFFGVYKPEFEDTKAKIDSLEYISNSSTVKFKKTWMRYFGKRVYRILHYIFKASSLPF